MRPLLNPTRRQFLAGTAATAGALGLPRAVGAAPDAVVFVVSERGLPAADLVAGEAPDRPDARTAPDGWGGVRRTAAAAPARCGFTGKLSTALPRLAARADGAVATDLVAAADDWFQALDALGLEGRVRSGLARGVIGGSFRARCRAALSARVAGAPAVVVHERADWNRPSAFARRAAALDDGVADLLDGLAAAGCAADTLVVVASAVGRARHGRIHGWREESRAGALALAWGPGAQAAVAARTTLELRDRTLGQVAAHALS